MKHNYFLNKTRQDFLLSFFDRGDEYEEKLVNGFYLIKQMNSRYEWEVAIYTPSAYWRRQDRKKRISNLIATRGKKRERV